MEAPHATATQPDASALGSGTTAFCVKATASLGVVAIARPAMLIVPDVKPPPISTVSKLKPCSSGIEAQGVVAASVVPLMVRSVVVYIVTDVKPTVPGVIPTNTR